MVHVELIIYDSADGAFNVGPPTCIPLVLVELDVRDGTDRAFDAGPPACIPNSSPSQVRFNESTPMS
jgi:hypothetical protein